MYLLSPLSAIGDKSNPSSLFLKRPPTLSKALPKSRSNADASVDPRGPSTAREMSSTAPEDLATSPTLLPALPPASDKDSRTFLATLRVCDRSADGSKSSTRSRSVTRWSIAMSRYPPYSISPAFTFNQFPSMSLGVYSELELTSLHRLGCLSSMAFTLSTFIQVMSFAE